MTNFGGHMSLELTITLKDEERTYKQKFLVYESVTFSVENDPIIMKCILEARKNFEGEPEDVVVRATMVMK